MLAKDSTAVGYAQQIVEPDEQIVEPDDPMPRRQDMTGRERGGAFTGEELGAELRRKLPARCFPE